MDSPYRPGVEEDFDRLYRDSHDRILRTLIVILRDRAAAEECAQEAFLRAFKAWPRWRPDAPAEAWVHRIAVHVASSYRRREALRTLGSTLRLVGPPAPERTDEDHAGRSDLIAALRRLPARQAAIVVLRHHHGYTNREIAIALGVPESTVSSRLVAAKERLRAELRVPGDGEDEPHRDGESLAAGPRAFSRR